MKKNLLFNIYSPFLNNLEHAQLMCEEQRNATMLAAAVVVGG
jgi:hypothetical protein